MGHGIGTLKSRLSLSVTVLNGGNLPRPADGFDEIAVHDTSCIITIVYDIACTSMPAYVDTGARKNGEEKKHSSIETRHPTATVIVVLFSKVAE
jgi:hypothetical protein